MTTITTIPTEITITIMITITIIPTVLTMSMDMVLETLHILYGTTKTTLLDTVMNPKVPISSIPLLSEEDWPSNDFEIK